MKQLPIPIWLVLAFLVCGVMSTLLGLGGVLNYTPEILIGSFVVVAFSVWLMAEIWWSGPRMGVASVTIWFALVAVQILAYVQFVPDPSSDISALAQWRTVLVFSVAMVAIYGLIPFVVFRYGEAPQ